MEGSPVTLFHYTPVWPFLVLWNSEDVPSPRGPQSACFLLSPARALQRRDLHVEAWAARGVTLVRVTDGGSGGCSYKLIFWIVSGTLYS